MIRKQKHWNMKRYTATTTKILCNENPRGDVTTKTQKKHTKD